MSSRYPDEPPRRVRSRWMDDDCKRLWTVPSYGVVLGYAIPQPRIGHTCSSHILFCHTLHRWSYPACERMTPPYAPDVHPPARCRRILEVRLPAPLYKRTCSVSSDRPTTQQLVLPTTMKATLSSLVGLGLAASANAWLQDPSGTASFTYYSGCGQAGMVFGSSVRRLLMLDDSACGKTANGFTAAISQLTFGSSPGLGAGDVCGRCFSITGKADPYSPSFSG